MSKIIVHQLQRAEGNLRVVQDEKSGDVWLESDQSLFLENYLEKRPPLEAIQLVQHLSTHAGPAHAMAAVMALENYSKLEPTYEGYIVRRLIYHLSLICSHVYQFYWAILPDYISRNHLKKLRVDLPFFEGSTLRKAEKGDLSTKRGTPILSNLAQSQKALESLHRIMATLGGKFPILMNFIPGGVSNFSIPKKMLMQVLRELEDLKEFLESTWPEDVKAFIQALPSSQKISQEEMHLISFGSLPFPESKKGGGFYSSGVFLDGKLEPLNELKITESTHGTYFDFVLAEEGPTKLRINREKQGNNSWIRGARYEAEGMQTGSLARMLVTHYGGSNSEISDAIEQVRKDLKLSFEKMDCLASRLLTDVFESRFLLKDIFTSLTEVDFSKNLNQKTPFDFSFSGVGIGKVEAAGGALFHQVYIENGSIHSYRIITPSNWKLAPKDEFGNRGIVEIELNRLASEKKLNSIEINRVLHAYYIQPLEATR